MGNKKQSLPLSPSVNVEFRESQVHTGVYRDGPNIVLGGKGEGGRKSETGGNRKGLLNTFM